MLAACRPISPGEEVPLSSLNRKKEEHDVIDIDSGEAHPTINCLGRFIDNAEMLVGDGLVKAVSGLVAGPSLPVVILNAVQSGGLYNSFYFLMAGTTLWTASTLASTHYRYASGEFTNLELTKHVGKSVTALFGGISWFCLTDSISSSSDGLQLSCRRS